MASRLSKLEWMEIHLSTLFHMDASGRLLSANERRPSSAPRFVMGRTAEGNLWRFRHDLPQEVVRELEPLCQSEPHSADFTSPPRNEAAIKAVLTHHAPIQAEERGPAYWIPESVTMPPDVVLLSESNAHLLQAGFPWMLPLPPEDEIGPVVAAVAESIAVAVCYCARLPQQATEAGVETMEPFRGKGYATAAVTGWAVTLHQRGILPLYSTSWENLASQGVTRSLGMELYGEDWLIE